MKNGNPFLKYPAVWLWLVIAAVVAGLVLTGARREQRTVARVMAAQGETLIRAVEAGGRIGMRGPGGASFRLRFLLEEMVRQEDLRFVALIHADGSLDAYAESSTGSGPAAAMFLEMAFGVEANWTLLPHERGAIFVVFREYRPLRPIPRNGHFPHGHGVLVPSEPPRFVAVGLDAAPYVQARRKDVVTLAVAGVLGLGVVLAALASFFWWRKAVRLETEMVKAERLAALGTLAAGVAHEIRNPLSSIKGFATYFREKFAAGSPDHELANVMVGEVERLNRVVSELLELTRPSDLRPMELRLSELLGHALTLVEADCAAHNIAVRTDFCADESMVSADRDRLLQVLLNVLLNAVQSMPEGGRLLVRVAQTRDHVAVSVKDTGVGVGQEDLSRVFDPYFTTRNKGTGLGLPLVRKIMDAHGGKVRMASVPGQGTEVVLEFPRPGGEK